MFDQTTIISNAILGSLAGLGGLLILNLSSWDGFLVALLAFGAAFVRDYLWRLYISSDISNGAHGTTGMPGAVKNMPHGMTNPGGGYANMSSIPPFA